ncbi:unnamed protein product [Triticum turgidum subsp. durum]|uniref:DUF4220 domain-containing protein n=1 Tax=Triticum turgidum subsp. durum TaxID=4567 RepID=A0A9R0W7A4_TRITD|nr:unnamed protein product [Triticum turgidum subsp. durum]
MRRHSVSRVLNFLIWLAYLSADSVAIFVLGHLAVHASGSHHLLIFWAPFLLLHLGGQDTITAFSTHDNELWRRHLLGLVTQASVAGYVISISSWQNRLLLAATVLMFLSGVFKYIGRTFCLYMSRPESFRGSMVLNLDKYVNGIYNAPYSDGRYSCEQILVQRLYDMMLNKVRLPPLHGSNIMLDSPLNDMATIEGAHIIPDLLHELKSSPNRFGAYVYVSKRLVRSYEAIYTKAFLHFAWSVTFKAVKDYNKKTLATILLHIFSFLLLFPLISALVTLKLFMDAEKAQLYTQTDVTISYILLIGATILEVASLFLSILSYFASEEAISCPPVACLASYIHPAGGHRKHWSKMLSQYNIMEWCARQNATCMDLCMELCNKSLLSQWIDKTYSRIVVSEDLEELVLGKLIDLGMGDKKCWNFASFRGQIALRRWTAMCTIIDSADLPTSVMIWHTATELCYYGYDRSNNYHQTNKMKVSRELSNYIMYLVFKCDVMLRSSSKLIHSNTCKEINEAGSFPFEIFERNLERRQQAATTIRVDIPSSSSNNEPITQVQLLKNNIKALTCPVLPRACTVVGEMGGMSADDRWDLIAEVWLEMLFYIAPRCGSAFHAQHLGTGGEFVTHVLLLMKLLGPFLPPPDA